MANLAPSVTVVAPGRIGLALVAPLRGPDYQTLRMNLPRNNWDPPGDATGEPLSAYLQGTIVPNLQPQESWGTVG